ncbi:site-specific integrase [Acetobacter orientalis]|uniref:site-specific integrase n=1 Tax=Acetobacter orientalis TaxID=146474 RepID=UPI0039EA74F0
MSLKLTTFKHTKNWFIRGTIEGRRILESTGTTNKKQAEEYRRKREAELWQERIYGAREVVNFEAAALAYIKDQQRSPATLRYLDKLVMYFGAWKLKDINNAALRGAYSNILQKGEEASPATKKRAIRTPLQAVLEHAAILGWCDRPAFAPISVQKKPKKFLMPDEATLLIEHAADHLKPLLVFLLCTGCRASEAFDLKWADVDLRGKRATVWQKQGRQRFIDLCPTALHWLQDIEWRDGYVFRPVRLTKGAPIIGERYHDAGRQYGGQMKRGWAGACRRAGFAGRIREWTPKGSKKVSSIFVPELTPHCLRHTWASWHYCVHKDILRLQSDGDWSDIGVVTEYAKLMPDAYKDDIIRWWSHGPNIAKIP